jgi:hypothetical protein
VSQREFDIAKWTFFLVAFVIVAHVIAALLAEGACLYFAEELMKTQKECVASGKLMEVLGAALAAALAFAGGRMSTMPQNKKPDYDENDPDGV